MTKFFSLDFLDVVGIEKHFIICLIHDQTVIYKAADFIAYLHFPLTVENGCHIGVYDETVFGFIFKGVGNDFRKFRIAELPKPLIDQMLPQGNETVYRPGNCRAGHGIMSNVKIFRLFHC